LIYDEGGRNGETEDWFRVFWENVYLRGPALFEASGTISKGHYDQPSTGLPFGRGFIIGRDGRVVLPYFGHQPRLVIDTIHELLDRRPAPRRPLRRRR
jgi:hypothetical protein